MAEGLYRIGGKSGNGRRAPVHNYSKSAYIFNEFVFIYEKFSKDFSKGFVKSPCFIFQCTQ